MPNLTSVPTQVNLGAGSTGLRSNVNLGADRTALTCGRYRTEGRTVSRRGGGKTAHYTLRWVATTGEKGPWSETASATIGA